MFYLPHLVFKTFSQRKYPAVVIPEIFHLRCQGTPVKTKDAGTTSSVLSFILRTLLLSPMCQMAHIYNAQNVIGISYSFIAVNNQLVGMVSTVVLCDGWPLGKHRIVLDLLNCELKYSLKIVSTLTLGFC